ncbi:hypothetical protein DFH29DRAFT_873471 [Suillus ampliporus]|nr:hypothetical protein DFH29DRAFT_873471 [Suillus ampliporus]
MLLFCLLISLLLLLCDLLLFAYLFLIALPFDLQNSIHSLSQALRASQTWSISVLDDQVLVSHFATMKFIHWQPAIECGDGIDMSQESCCWKENVRDQLLVLMRVNQENVMDWLVVEKAKMVGALVTAI